MLQDTKSESLAEIRAAVVEIQNFSKGLFSLAIPETGVDRELKGGT